MPNRLQGLRVLVVEDEALIAMTMADVLEEAGCTVVGPMPRLDLAVKAAHEEKIDAALLDVNLAGEAVFPVADVLEGRKIPFIFLTGYGTPDSLGKHHDRPAMRKPIILDDLLQGLTQLVDSARTN